MVHMAYMSYTTNPHIAKVRRDAVRLVKYRRWSIRKVARHIGVHPSTVMRWCEKDVTGGWAEIPTKSSRPHTHPGSLSVNIVDRIMAIRKEHGRCAEVVRQTMLNEGYSVSLSSVKRTLDRHGLTKKRTPLKRYHAPLVRPYVAYPGDLVEIDTIHVGEWHPKRLYVYTLIDVYTRWAWAQVGMRVTTHRSIRFVRDAQRSAPFTFATMQSDHGSEFSTYFTEHMGVAGMQHRHTRLRKPNDNAHIERFNRTIQEECFDGVPRKLRAYRDALSEYLPYYNHERMHLGIDFKKPIELT